MERLLRDMPRAIKGLLWLCIDTLLVAVSLYIAFSLRLGTPTSFPMMQSAWGLFPLLSVLGGIASYSFRLHRIQLHSFDVFAMRRIGFVALVLTGGAVMLSYMLDLWAPRSVPLIFGVVFFMIALTRYLRSWHGRHSTGLCIAPIQ